jgi:chemotaxis protein histidine kinase CheA
MDTQEILSKIAKLKKAVASEEDADVKASFNKKIATLEAQVAESEAKVEKKEEKSAAEEKKTLSEAEEKIKKLEKAIASEEDADVKSRFQKKLNELKGTLKDVKEEIKEEKKEIAEQKKEIKQAVKEVQSVQKEVRKTAIKKVAAKKVERKKVEAKKTKRGEKLQSVLSDLDAMIEKNRKLKSKYGSGYEGTGKPSDLERDAKRKAKPFGYRFIGKHDYRVPTEMQIKRGLKRGTIDYEARPNRADVNPDKKIKLADGGMMAKGGDIDYKTYIHINKKNESDVFPLIDDGYYVKLSKHKEVFLGGQIFKEGMTKTEAINFAKDLMGRYNIPNENLIIDEEWRVNQMADGGMMAKGGRTKAAIVADKRYKALKAGKRTSEDGNVYYESRANRSDVNRRDKLEDGGMMKKGGKVGYSKEDKARYAKPAGWRWKDEAVTKRIIERKQLSMQPSKKMRDKYPDLVYFEDRLNKADIKPTRTSADSI